MKSGRSPAVAIWDRAACLAAERIDMPRDNEELGRFLEALNRNKLNRPDKGKRRQSRIRTRFSTRVARLKDLIGLVYMMALLWGAHWLMRLATRLFFNGFLSASKTRTLLRWAAYLNRASLLVLRHRQRRRLVSRYAGNDNNDRRA
ncbi:hypothetical protein GA0061103_3518 [Rhizobium multihospitium]|uniref:Transposase DDE domain-containing protein n=2 Tax=Rhizobium multihospitium TaxID=410764 RepID=A0A1C3VCM5_9HYPH|nr:hypothetical protein GA0061103_3518 [Rhizobium multihospitium]